MKLVLTLLLVVACYAYTPINKQSWINFQNVKDPTYKTVPDNGEPNIIHATHIVIEEKISELSKMIHKSLRDFQEHMTNYTADVTE